jgi:hypothetical protein
MDDNNNAAIELDHLSQPRVIAKVPSFKPYPATEVERKLRKSDEQFEKDGNLAVSDPGLLIARNNHSQVETQLANANNQVNVSRISDGHLANHAINSHDEQEPSRSRPPVEVFPETEG